MRYAKGFTSVEAVNVEIEKTGAFLVSLVAWKDSQLVCVFEISDASDADLDELPPINVDFESGDVAQIPTVPVTIDDKPDFVMAGVFGVKYGSRIDPRDSEIAPSPLLERGDESLKKYKTLFGSH